MSSVHERSSVSIQQPINPGPGPGVGHSLPDRRRTEQCGLGEIRVALRDSDPGREDSEHHDYWAVSGVWSLESGPHSALLNVFWIKTGLQTSSENVLASTVQYS